MATSKTANYTADQIETMTDLYMEHGNEGLELIAEALGKSVRSVRSKLVREGVYVATPKAAAVKKDTGPTKKELLNELESVIGFDVTPLQGSTKAGIEALIAYAKSHDSEMVA